MRRIGLTGGIGMGKSTVALAFRRAGIPVFDADAAVHKMYQPGGAAVRAIGAAFPGVVVDDAIDRAKLRALVVGDPGKFKELERLVHPLVLREELAAVARARRAGRRAVVIDNPLLFEMNLSPRDRHRHERLLTDILVVSAPAAIQVHRVRRRRTMSDEQIRAVIAKQMPDREKQRRARAWPNRVVRTGLSRNLTLRPVRRMILEVLA
jgi:dephospho-CoA kinase